MRNLFCLILLLSLCAGIVGCKEPAKKPDDPLLNGVKIGDLIPKHTKKQPEAINFKIFTFQIPLSDYENFSGVFDALSKDLMRFSNQKSFRANGFAAGLGNKDSFQVVGNYLRKVNARRTKTSSLIAYEYPGEDPYPGNDFLIGNISSGTLASYYDLERNSREISLTPGLLGWRIKARKIAHRRGLVQVKIQGIFKPMLSSMLSQAKEFDNGKTFDTGEIIFKPTSMVMNLNEGDFVLIGARPNAIFSEPTDDENGFDIPKNNTAAHPIRLVELFFKTRGSMNLPKETEDKGKDSQSKEVNGKEGKTGEIFYKHVKDIDIAEVFLILSMGVEN